MPRSMHIYRPQRTRAELLEETSVGREPLVTSIVERLARWTPGASRQHYLLIGPRGIGKTHLLRLIEHRLRSHHELETRWTPIALAEDFYSITRVSDLLLEMLRVLGQRGTLLLSFHVGSETIQADDFLDTGVTLDFQLFQIPAQLHHLTEPCYVNQPHRRQTPCQDRRAAKTICGCEL